MSTRSGTNTRQDQARGGKLCEPNGAAALLLSGMGDAQVCCSHRGPARRRPRSVIAEIRAAGNLTLRGIVHHLSQRGMLPRQEEGGVFNVLNLLVRVDR